MHRELTAEEVIYKFEFNDIKLRDDNNEMPEYDEVYKKIKTALEIEKEGYNVYLIDDFSKDKLQKIISFIKENLEYKEKPQDICYVVQKEEKYPKALFLPGGEGKKLKEMLEKVQKIYSDSTYEFYTSSSNKDKEKIVDNLQKKKSNLINKLLKAAEEDGFTMKPTQNGFTFIPMKDKDGMMNEKDYDDLGIEEKEEILTKVGALKNNAQDVLEQLKDMELCEIEKIKVLMDGYYSIKTEDIKKEYLNKFRDHEEAIEYLNNICCNIENDIKDIYSISYEDDEEEINEIIYKYVVNVLVDNSDSDAPDVIFEEDPNINNLLGSIEYENKNGVYVTDISLIKSGSILKANGGCLIIRVNNLLSNASAYYYFKKSLISGKVDLDYNRGYLELLSLNGLKPEPIKFNEKIILIGDYNTYDFMYNYDEDFRKIFTVRAEYKSIVEINEDIKQSFLLKVFNICKYNNLYSLTDDAITEVAKFLSRKAEDKNKLYIDDQELSKILMMSNNKVKADKRTYIEAKDIIDIVYDEELIEKQINDGYKENKIFINVKDKLVGQVNGLSVIDVGYCSFGKPIRITCCSYKGDGNIVDVQKESNLSGNIHNKAISILRGYINNLIGGYEKIPVDFHLSFEQLYGKIDGDSASVGEAISMISSLSKIGVKQNIAVTGSINQFGEVQPIGGVNDKIEGFFKICKLIDKVTDKGVLIPEANLNSLVLNKEIEEEIKNGNFHIYSMSSIEDAVQVLMGEKDIGYKEVMDELDKELKKYVDKNKKK